MSSPTRPSLRCRTIETADLPAIVGLVARGFPSVSVAVWQQALARLDRHTPPAGSPKYGYMLEAAGEPVGLLLVISKALTHEPGAPVRSNFSSWYTLPDHRAYASMLVSRALRDKASVLVNISARPPTYPVIEAQGFRRYSDGLLLAAPAVVIGGPHISIARVEASGPLITGLPEPEMQLLCDHAGFGCISLVCNTPEGPVPLVFARRRLKMRWPCAQLVYCRDVADLARCAGPVGRLLSSRGLPIVALDAGGPIAGLPGRFFPGRNPRYFRGVKPPRLGDLAYTEMAMLGL